MQVHLIAHSDTDLEAVVGRLARTLPPEITSAATLCMTSDLGDAGAPRYVASLEGLTDAQLDTVRCAFERLDAPGLELTHAAPRIASPKPDGPPADPPAEFFGATTEELAAIEADTASLTDILTQIMKADRTGIDFPEKSWAGARKEAYDVFVKRLGGIEPWRDKGASLSVFDIAKQATPKPHHIEQHTWNLVRDHLERELKCFAWADDWFGINGKVNALAVQQRLRNSDFVASMNDKYLLLGGDQSVSVSIDACMSIAVKAISAVSGWGKAVSAIVGALWIVTKSQLPDPQAEIKAAIRDVEAQAAQIFESSLQHVNQANAALAEDWGLLTRFGSLIEAGELAWPRDAGPIYSAHARAFQYVALRSCVHLMSHTKTLTQFSIGVVDVTTKVKGKQDGRWSGMHYETHSVHNKGGPCGIGAGWYCRRLFLGWMVVAPGASKPFWGEDGLAPLQKKLFGKNTTDETEPEFGLTQGFLLSPKDSQRSGWALDQLPFSAT